MQITITVPEKIDFYTNINGGGVPELENALKIAVGAKLKTLSEDITIELKNDHRVRAYCPNCKNWVLLRRKWHSVTTTYVGCEDGSVYPADSYPSEVDETQYDQPREFYCAECGEILFFNDAEVAGYVKGLKDAAV